MGYPLQPLRTSFLTPFSNVSSCHGIETGQMSSAKVTISDTDRELLVAHYHFYRSLESGDRFPSTAAQQHFVRVCQGSVAPESDHEFAYLRFKRAVEITGLDESVVVGAGFVFPISQTQDSELVEFDVVDVPVRPCTECGRLIPPMRLEALPNATRCVACQKQSDSDLQELRKSDVDCPRCAMHGLKSPLVWRTARDPTLYSGYFLGCSRFPACRYIDQS